MPKRSVDTEDIPMRKTSAQREEEARAALEKEKRAERMGAEARAKRGYPGRLNLWLSGRDKELLESATRLYGKSKKAAIVAGLFLLRSKLLRKKES